MDISIDQIKELGAYGVVIVSYVWLLKNLIQTSKMTTSAISSSTDATRAHTEALKELTTEVRNGNGKA